MKVSREDLLHEIATIATQRATQKELNEAYYNETANYFGGEYDDEQLINLLNELTSGE
jgi:hypothetical protein